MLLFAGAKDAPAEEAPPPPPAPTSLVHATIVLCRDTVHTSAQSPPESALLALDGSTVRLVPVAPTVERRDDLQCGCW